MRIFQYVLLFLLSSFALSSHAQRVGVNHKTPTENLDVNGTMRVRTLPLAGTAGISTQTDGTAAATPTVVFVPKHAIVADANGVLGRRALSPDFFYMPPMVFPTQEADAKENVTVNDGVFTVNLYNEYVKQFVTDAPTASSTQTPLYQWQADQLDYHVTYYDAVVFSDVSVSPEGVLTYKVKAGAQPSEKTYFNIVLKVK